MKILYVITFIFYSIQQHLLPITPESYKLYELALSSYDQNDMDQTYKLLAQISEKNNVVYFMMGECAFKQAHYGLALLHWRQAEKTWRLWGRHQLLSNISAAKKQISHVQSLEFSFAFLKTYITSMITSLPLLYPQIILLILWTLIFLLFKRLRRRKKYFLITILFLALCFTAAVLIQKYSLESMHVGVSIQKSDLFSGPGRNFAKIGLLPEATEVAIIREQGDFYKVQIAHNIGWIEKRTIEKI